MAENTSKDNLPVSERVNNRSLRPNSSTFKEFMTQGWQAETPQASPLESSKYTPARLLKLSQAFPGERLVIPAGVAKVRNNDCDFRFRPDTTFAYYTGLGEDYEPGAVLVLDPQEQASSTGMLHQPILFVHARYDYHTPEFFRSASYGEYWTGARPGIAEFGVMTGLESRDVKELASLLAKNVGSEAHDVKLRVVKEADPQVTELVESIRVHAGFTDHATNQAADDELHQFAAEARMFKDEWEISEMDSAIRATRHGFDNILRHLDKAEGKENGERILEAAFDSISRIEGNDVGYGTIVASGDDAPTLHWMRNTHAVQSQDMLLIDAGIESKGLYTADITRTFPVSGKFSPVQRKLYEAVYKAQLAGFEAVHIGGTYSDIHHACMRSLCESLAEWGVLPVSVEEALSPEGQQHRRWHACGVAHHLGLDVHDCAEARFCEYQGGTFKPGMIFTIEPGLYFRRNDLLVPEEFRGIGIRIEDDVLITEDGPVWMSKKYLPSAPDDVEAWMAEQRKLAGQDVD